MLWKLGLVEFLVGMGLKTGQRNLGSWSGSGGGVCGCRGLAGWGVCGDKGQDFGLDDYRIG